MRDAARFAPLQTGRQQHPGCGVLPGCLLAPAQLVVAVASAHRVTRGCHCCLPILMLLLLLLLPPPLLPRLLAPRSRHWLGIVQGGLLTVRAVSARAQRMAPTAAGCVCWGAR